jgi:hypothetical protein
MPAATICPIVDFSKSEKEFHGMVTTSEHRPALRQMAARHHIAVFALLGFLSLVAPSTVRAASLAATSATRGGWSSALKRARLRATS